MGESRQAGASCIRPQEELSPPPLEPNLLLLLLLLLCSSEALTIVIKVALMGLGFIPAGCPTDAFPTGDDRAMLLLLSLSWPTSLVTRSCFDPVFIY